MRFKTYWAATMGDNGAPQEQREERGWDDDAFDQEENSKFLDGHTSQDRLEYPVYELGE